MTGGRRPISDTPISQKWAANIRTNLISAARRRLGCSGRGAGDSPSAWPEPYPALWRQGPRSPLDREKRTLITNQGIVVITFRPSLGWQVPERSARATGVVDGERGEHHCGTASDQAWSRCDLKVDEGRPCRLMAGACRALVHPPLLPGQRPRRAPVGDRRAAARVARSAGARRARRTCPVGLGASRSHRCHRPVVVRHYGRGGLPRVAGLTSLEVADRPGETSGRTRAKGRVRTDAAAGRTTGCHWHGRVPAAACSAAGLGTGRQDPRPVRHGEPKRSPPPTAHRPSARASQKAIS